MSLKIDFANTFFVAREEVLEAARMLMPFPEQDMDDFSPDARVNHEIYKVIEQIEHSRVVPIEALEKSAREILRKDRAEISFGAVIAAARRDVACDIAAVMVSDKIKAGSYRKRFYLSERFLEIADQSVQYLSSGALYLVSPRFIALEAKPYSEPVLM